MSSSDDASSELNFDRAVFTEKSAGAAPEAPVGSAVAPPAQSAVSSSNVSCGTCSGSIGNEYFKRHGLPLCMPCFSKMPDEQKRAEGVSGEGSFGAAVLFGVLGGTLGAGIYYGITALTGYELGLIAIVVGVLAGKGVRLGARSKNHWIYRAMGTAFAYVAIVSTYIPGVLEGLRTGADATDGPFIVELVLATVLSWMAPFFLLKEFEVMGLIIMGIGVWEGWKFSAPGLVGIEGPFRFEPSAVSAPAASS